MRRRESCRSTVCFAVTDRCGHERVDDDVEDVADELAVGGFAEEGSQEVADRAGLHVTCMSGRAYRGEPA